MKSISTIAASEKVMCDKNELRVIKTMTPVYALICVCASILFPEGIFVECHMSLR